MANLTNFINLNVDAHVKDKSPVKMTLTQVVKRNGVPFEVVSLTPSKELLEALSEVEEMKNNSDKYPRYSNREDLKRALLSDDE